MLRATRNSGGFSLIEVLVALFILGAAITAAIGLVSNSLSSVRKAEAHAMCTVYARSLIEEALAYDDVSKIPVPTPEVPGYQVSRSIEQLEADEGIVTYEISVEVAHEGLARVSMKARKSVRDETE